MVRLRVGVRGYGCRITLELLYIFQELTGMEFCDTESQDPTTVSATRLLELQLGSLSQKPSTCESAADLWCKNKTGSGDITRCGREQNHTHPRKRRRNEETGEITAGSELK